MESKQDVGLIRRQLQNAVFRSAIGQTANPYSQSVFRQLANCRTANTGVHLLRCNDADCGHQSYQYHNCGNRHCPNCGGMKRQQWLEDKMSDLLPTTYYHACPVTKCFGVVFTLPHELNSLIMGNRKELFALLFESASYTLQKLAEDEKWLGATPGIISILHTWGQTLNFHPHVHCIVSGGGVKEDKDGGIRWVKEKRRSGNYLFPGTAMQQIYKAYFLKRLRKMVARNKVQVTDKPATEYLLHEIGFKRWNVYAKRPFGGPGQVMEYLGRYTHKIAITAHRILEIDETAQTIRFAYKDYRKRGTKEIGKEMTLPIKEFIRLFEQHILPKRFVKIRHYGYLRPHNRSKRIKGIFALLKLPPPPSKVQVPVSVRMMESFGIDIFQCSKCKHGRMEMAATYRRDILVKTYEDAQPTIRNKDPAL